MTRIYLVRHAKYSNPEDICAGRLPFPLSEEGRRDAKKLQEYFKDKNISKIFSSRVMRCKETSEIISDNIIKIVFDQRLLETFTPGQGRKGNIVENYFGLKSELGGESLEDIYNRVKDFWINTEFEDGSNYIICSHGEPLYQLYLYLANLPLLPEFETLGHFPYTPNYQEKGSVRLVEIGNSKVSVKDTNETLS